MMDSKVAEQWECTIPFESYIKAEKVEIEIQSGEFEPEHHQLINNETETETKFKSYKSNEINFEEFDSKPQQLVNDEIDVKFEPYMHVLSEIKSEEFESEQQNQLINNEIDITFETYQQVPNEIFFKVENIEFKVEDNGEESTKEQNESRLDEETGNQEPTESNAATPEIMQDTWVCGHCDFLSNRKDDVRGHLTSAHKDRSKSNTSKCNYKCCYYKSIHMHKVTWQDMYYKSYRQSHPEPPDPETETPPEKPERKCCLCDFKYTDRNDLGDHIRLKHKDPGNTKMFKCNVCEFGTKYFHQLVLHTANHGRPSAFRHSCDKCSYQTMQRNSLTRHMAKHGTSKEYTCDSCPFKTLAMKHLKQHVLTHESTSATPWHQCQVCEYRTVSRFQLTLHVHRHLWKDL